MPQSDFPTESVNRRARTTRTVHLLCYALLGAVFAYVGVARYLQPLVFNESIGVEPARVRLIQQLIDPNTAGWPELAYLPGIGEILAKRIVAYREQQSVAVAGGDGPYVVFAKPEDLEKVTGIGPKTVARIRPFLKLPDEEKQAGR